MRPLTLFDDLILPSHVSAGDAAELMEELRTRGLVVGTDEAGRGPLAGPVVAAAAYLSRDQEKELVGLGLKDSKKMTLHARERVFEAMNTLGVLWRAQAGSVERIGRDNILQASLWAMGRSVVRLCALLPARPFCVVVDGPARITETDLLQWPLVMGDRLLPVVAAASVIAKVLRDRIMRTLDSLYPGYGLAQNKGYATPAHREAVLRLGLSPAHRRFFCRKILGSSTINKKNLNIPCLD